MAMFDVTAERPISVTEAADLLPSRKPGKKIAIKTIVRWITKGYFGVHLEGGRFGDSFCTSREALARFAAALAEKSCVKKPSKAGKGNVRTDRAKKSLENKGWRRRPTVTK